MITIYPLVLQGLRPVIKVAKTVLKNYNKLYQNCDLRSFTINSLFFTMTGCKARNLQLKNGITQWKKLLIQKP